MAKNISYRETTGSAIFGHTDIVDETTRIHIRGYDNTSGNALYIENSLGEEIFKIKNDGTFNKKILIADAINIVDIGIPYPFNGPFGSPDYVYLLNGQNDPTQNGLWIEKPGDWIRHPLLNQSSQLSNDIFVRDINGNFYYTLIKTPGDIGSVPIYFNRENYFRYLKGNVFANDIGLPTTLSTGTSNTFITGFNGYGLTSGSYNVSIGNGAIETITTGSSNVAIGNTAGVFIDTGSDNVFIGTAAGFNSAFGSTGNTMIGKDAQPASFGATNNNLIISTGAGKQIEGNGTNLSMVNSGNYGFNTTTFTGYGAFAVNKTTATLAKDTNCGTYTKVQQTAASNNATVDALLLRDSAGSVLGNNHVVGHFYVYVTGASGVNAFSGVYTLVHTGNGVTNATLTATSTVTRGTSPVTSVQIAADGGGGAVKLTITYINNAGVVSGGFSRVSFVGNIN